MTYRGSITSTSTKRDIAECLCYGMAIGASLGGWVTLAFVLLVLGLLVHPR